MTLMIQFIKYILQRIYLFFTYQLPYDEDISNP
jgi:hypothetical protein